MKKLLIRLIRRSGIEALVARGTVVVYRRGFGNTHDGFVCHHGGQYGWFDVAHGVTPLLRDFRMDHPYGT